MQHADNRLSDLTLFGCNSLGSDQLRLSSSSNSGAILLRRQADLDLLPVIFAANGQVQQLLLTVMIVYSGVSVGRRRFLWLTGAILFRRHAEPSVRRPCQ
jgi:hypothetical protein